MSPHLLRDMALFVEVVKAGQFTRAAENLGMPPSTLSRRVAQLERDIGLRLLHRTTRQVEVSDAGADYYARCAHLLEEARVAHEAVAQAAHKPSGTLKLSCSPDFASRYLPPVLQAYLERYPGVSVELDLTPRRADLVAEGLDAALRIGRLPDSSLVARPVATLQAALYASPGYLASAPELLQPEHLQAHQCLRMKAGAQGAMWELHRAAIRPEPGVWSSAEVVQVQVKGRLVASSVGLLREFTLRGLGIGAIEPAWAEPEVQAGHLVPVLPGWAFKPTPIHLLTPSRLMPARVRAFAECLGTALGTPAFASALTSAALSGPGRPLGQPVPSSR
jgi:DNA-binding transcriptional LysR family regulator